MGRWAFVHVYFKLISLRCIVMAIENVMSERYATDELIKNKNKEKADAKQQLSP